MSLFDSNLLGMVTKGAQPQEVVVGWFTTKLLSWVLGAVVLLSGAGWLFYHVKVLGLENEVLVLKNDRVTMEGNNTILKGNNQKLQIQLSEQNKQITEFINEQEKASKAADAAIKTARQNAWKWKKKYASLLESAKAIPENDCASLSVKMDSYIDLRKEEAKP